MLDSPMFPVLAASDIERAKAWYRDKLGMEPMFEDLERGMAGYSHAGGMVLVYLSEFAGTNGATAAGFVSEDFDADVAALRERGVVFEDLEFPDGSATVDGVAEAPDGSGGKSAWFKDSEGNILAISTPPPA